MLVFLAGCFYAAPCIGYVRSTDQPFLGRPRVFLPNLVIELLVIWLQLGLYGWNKRDRVIQEGLAICTWSEDDVSFFKTHATDNSIFVASVEAVEMDGEAGWPVMVVTQQGAGAEHGSDPAGLWTSSPEAESFYQFPHKLLTILRMHVYSKFNCNCTKMLIL